jgi:hypothetical protein
VLRELAQLLPLVVAFETVFKVFKSAIFAIGIVELGDPSEAEDLSRRPSTRGPPPVRSSSPTSCVRGSMRSRATCART